MEAERALKYLLWAIIFAIAAIGVGLLVARLFA